MVSVAVVRRRQRKIDGHNSKYGMITSFKEWLARNESSMGAASQIRRRFSELPKTLNKYGDMSYQSKSQGQDDMWRAAKAAQELNKNNGGTTTVFHTINPLSADGTRIVNLQQTLAFLTSRSKEEISVSVHKIFSEPEGHGDAGIVLEGKGKLLMYYDKDVATDKTTMNQRIPTAPFRQDQRHSRWDEGIIRLANVRWDKMHIDYKAPAVQKFGGADMITNLAKQYNLIIVGSSPQGLGVSNQQVQQPSQRQPL